MRIAVIYYSHYGNVAYVANKLAEMLKSFGDVDLLEVDYSQKTKNIFKRIFFRIFPKLVKLAEIKTDLREFDIVCFGMPVWGGRPSSPMLKYLKVYSNIRSKKIICFYVYGFESSAKTCAAYVDRILRQKSKVSPVNVFIPWTKVHEPHFVNKVFNLALTALNLQK